MKIIVVSVCALLVSGCASSSDEERAIILNAYRVCVEHYAEEPGLLNQQCDRYRQSLMANDVRKVN